MALVFFSFSENLHVYIQADEGVLFNIFQTRSLVLFML